MESENHYSLCIKKLIDDWRAGRIIIGGNRSEFDEWKELRHRRYIRGKRDLKLIQGGKPTP